MLLTPLYVHTQGVHRSWETWATLDVMGFTFCSWEVMRKPVKHSDHYSVSFDESMNKVTQNRHKYTILE